MGLLRPDRGVVDPRYLLYVYIGPEFQETLHSRSVHGSTVNRILLTELPDFPIRIHCDLDEQRRIASILGALDDKIELNRKMNRTLEQIAQTLFRAWFVDFEGETDLVESDAGLMPNGWSVAAIGACIELAYGKSLPKRTRNPGEVPVFGSGGLTGSHDMPLVKGPGIVVGRKGTVGSVYWVDEDFYPIDTTFYVDVLHEGLTLRWVYFRLKQMDLPHLASDSAVPGVNRNAIYSRMWNLPSDGSLIGRFDRIAELLMERARANSQESRTLAALRDTLLPKLISGEIRVPEAEEAVEAVS